MIKYPPNLYRKSSLRPQTSHANKSKSFTPPRKRSGKSDEQFELERDEAFRHFVRTEYEVQISSLENANEALKKENQELKQQLLVPQEPQECISTQTDENVSKNIMMYSFDVDTKLSDAETKIRTLQVEKEWLNSRIYVMQKEIMSRQDAKSALDNINEKQKLIDTISQAKQAINNLEDENASLKKDLHEAKERIYYLTYKAGILFDGSSNALH
uniref:SH3 domain-containing protein n=1 Tax=Coptotermes formosanus TaxID=36987 RepID=R4UL97_COPFO|nr:SH3 domain-containing protein [Coptotermes formosanus]